MYLVSRNVMAVQPYIVFRSMGFPLSTNNFKCYMKLNRIIRYGASIAHYRSIINWYGESQQQLQHFQPLAVFFVFAVIQSELQNIFSSRTKEIARHKVQAVTGHVSSDFCFLYSVGFTLFQYIWIATHVSSSWEVSFSLNYKYSETNSYKFQKTKFRTCGTFMHIYAIFHLNKTGSVIYWPFLK